MQPLLLVALTFQAVDTLGNMIRAVGSGQETTDAQSLLANLDLLISGQEPVQSQAEQTEEDGETVRNDRFLAVPEVSQLFKEINSFDHLPEGIIAQIENFFKNYNEQAGKKFKVLDRLGPHDAFQIIQGS